MDFMHIKVEYPRRNEVVIKPEFDMVESKDLMTKGSDFYAIWDQENKIWSTSEIRAMEIIDNVTNSYYNEHKEEYIKDSVTICYGRNASSGVIDRFHKYVKDQLRDNYHILDQNLVFANTNADKLKSLYASKSLPYSLSPGDYSSWDQLIGTLYSPEEKHKIEWCIGSIVSGASKYLQKFAVLYGSAGTGKSTVLNIINSLFKPYTTSFEAKDLGMASKSFALEPFINNPLVAIQHDGNLAHIEDNSRLNSLISHEEMIVNTKFKSQYQTNFYTFLWLGTNEPVRISNAKSGLVRRLIDIQPTGNLVSPDVYDRLMNQIEFQKGAIAYHCKEVFIANPHYYDKYIPEKMIARTNEFYNFVAKNYFIFRNEDHTTLAEAWKLYMEYCNDCNITNKLPQRVFREELKNYFRDFQERVNIDKSRIRSYYSGFITEKFSYEYEEEKKVIKPEERVSIPDWLILKKTPSKLDERLADCPAQYANSKETPTCCWESVKTRLCDLDSTKLHYVRAPINDIFIDFDLKDENGQKSLKKNLEAATKWPPTYAEVSKGGSGLHLHYQYDGDVELLSSLVEENIEIKTCKGKSSIRRKLSICNDLDIATISGGLPLREERRTKRVVNPDLFKNEKTLRTMIIRNLQKKYHNDTKSSIDYIYFILDSAYKSNAHYDVSDLKNSVTMFAMGSTHNVDYCLKKVNQMQFKSSSTPDEMVLSKNNMVIFDVEVFPNLFLICWKYLGSKTKPVAMINPTVEELEEFFKYKLIGYNNKKYDNHVLYAASMGYDNQAIWEVSKKIISGDRSGYFYNSKNISYTDIFDFLSAQNKKSLKKWEIELGIDHKELDLDWDKPVPKELLEKVIEYCNNDVIATEAVFLSKAGQSDWLTRQILADLADGSVNDSTNELTIDFITKKEKNPEKEYIWRDLSKPVYNMPPDQYEFLKMACPEMMAQRHGVDGSLLPYFPGYTYDKYRHKSQYKGVEIGEGGYAKGRPGMYGNVALLDITSMHPHSAIADCIFGVKFTKRYREIVEARVSIKHEAWDEVNGMLDGKLTKHIQRVRNGELTAKQLANGLKTAINAVYGLTAAKFPNKLRCDSNIDNIVAKRGELFMIDLKEEVEKRGFIVAHIKTDSIKIPDATPEIIKFVMNFGKKYGYNFEHEATYDRMTLLNDAVYIAKFATAEKCQQLYGYIPDDNKKSGGKWTPTGTQFAVPYVFKTLFTHEPIIFEDMCETKQVSGGANMYIYMPDNTGQMKYNFVGRIGSFCPMKKGGGTLYRTKDNIKYDSVTGTKGYEWLQAIDVKERGLIDHIDKSYYDNLVNKAADALAANGNMEWFLSDDEYIPPEYVNGIPVYSDYSDYVA